MRCFDCGDEGHIATDCPNSALAADGKPPWCGICDERTRLIDGYDSVTRCQVCHPLRHKPLRQHRRCPFCHMLVYQWDKKECGSHSSPAADYRPGREHIDAVIAANSPQREMP